MTSLALQRITEVVANVGQYDPSRGIALMIPVMACSYKAPFHLTGRKHYRQYYIMILRCC